MAFQDLADGADAASVRSRASGDAGPKAGQDAWAERDAHGEPCAEHHARAEPCAYRDDDDARSDPSAYPDATADGYSHGRADSSAYHDACTYCSTYRVAYQVDDVDAYAAADAGPVCVPGSLVLTRADCDASALVLARPHRGPDS